MTLRPPFPDTLPELRDEAVCLRALAEADIPAWFARATDIESADLAGDPVPASIDMGPPWLQRQRDAFRNRTALRWAIVPAGVTESIGTVGLSFAEAGAPTAGLGVVIARVYWRMGVGTAAVRLALRYAFDVLRLEEIRAEVLQRNTASIGLLEKVGFGLVKILPPTAAEPEVMRLYSLGSAGQAGPPPPQELAGACLCGAVRYKLVGQPVVARICWCRTCQKISANGTANAIFASASIDVSGPMRVYASRADSGNEISRHFCPVCGCHLFAGSSASPQFRLVRLGTLDDPSAIRPQINMWTSSAPGWACLDPALRAEPGQPAPGPVPPGAGRTDSGTPS